MRFRFATIICAVIVARAAGAQSAPTSPIETLRWFAGCWQQVNRARGTVVDEQWMSPRGGTMLGMSRTVRGDSVVTEFEHLQVLLRHGRTVYHAEPSGQPAADFEAASVSDTLVLFENAKHDFPQRIIYRKRGADSLLARIEGTMNGKTRGVDFPYVRVPCAREM